MMELEQLRIFLAVVEHGGFRAAAAALYISHSTTCRHVAALEETLGVPLFRRLGRTLQLTPAGEILFRESKDLLGRAEETVRAVRRAGEREEEETLPGAVKQDPEDPEKRGK